MPHAPIAWLARAAAVAWSDVWSAHESRRDSSAAGGFELGFIGELAPFNSEVDVEACAAAASAAAESAASESGGAEAVAAYERLGEIGGGQGSSGSPWSDPAWGPWAGLLADEQQQEQQQEVASAEEQEGTDREEDEEAMRIGAEESARALLETEQRVWVELIACLYLSRQLRTAAPPPTEIKATEKPAAAEKAVALPDELRVLLPPPPSEGWPRGAPTADQPAEWLRGYPPLRRAQRFSFLVAALLPDLDKQALLCCSSTAERLDEELLHLQSTRERLAAIMALKGL